MASSSRTHSSSPYSNRKSVASSYYSTPSPSSFTNGKMIPRSCSTSASSSHYGMSGGFGSRSMVHGRGVRIQCTMEVAVMVIAHRLGLFPMT